ncbi:F-box/LRR-repeat protein-like protein [Tanacetum coccineum]
MDKIPKDLHVDILRRLDSDDVARCRFASKIFNDAYPHLRSIKLKLTIFKSSLEKHSKKNFVNLISNMRIVESVCIGVNDLREYVVEHKDDFNVVTDEDFMKKWLPKVSETLKSLSVTEVNWQQPVWRQSNVLQLVSNYCNKLVELKVKHARLSVDSFNPMSMLTSLTLESLHLYDGNITKLNMCAPNLQVLNLLSVRGLVDPKFHLLNLKSGQLTSTITLQSLSLITPKLIRLRLRGIHASNLYVEAPMLSHFDTYFYIEDAFSLTKFENLKHLSVKSLQIGSLLNNLTITETVEDLTVDTQEYWPGLANETCRLFTLEKLFTVFPKVTSLCIKSFAWREFELTLVPRYSNKITEGTKGLKTLSVYLNLHYLQISLSRITRVLDQYTGLSEVSLFIHKDVDGDVIKEIVSKCEAHCPRLNWRRGMWNGGTWLVVQGLLKDSTTYV